MSRRRLLVGGLATLMFVVGLPSSLQQQLLGLRPSPAAAAAPASYDQEVQADNPVTYWRFNDAAGTTLTDEEGNNPGTLQGNPLHGQPGVVPGDSSMFFGENDVYTAGASGLLPPSTLTVESWVKFDSTADDKTGGLFEILGSGYGLVILGSQATGFVCKGNNDCIVVGESPATKVADRRWHHLVLTKDSTTQRLFLDGVEVDEKPNAQNVFYGGTPFLAGDQLAIGGYQDETAIYNQALSPDRIRAHFAAALAGGLLSPTELPGSNAAEPCASHSRHFRYQPVDTSNGNFFHTFDDLSVPGRGMPLAFSHTYSSATASTDAGLGFGWTFSYDMTLAVNGNTAVVTQENGATATFTLTGGSWTPPPRVVATLVQSGSNWTFTRQKREVIAFNGFGLLASEQDLNGIIASPPYLTTITYPNPTTRVVTDPAGRTLTLTLSGGHVAQVADSASPQRLVNFAYDGLWNLTDVTDVGTAPGVRGVTHFTYDSNHRLLTMLDPNQAGSPSPVPITNHYDGSGRVDHQTDQMNRTAQFDYVTIPGSTIITDPKGNQILETYVNGELASMTKGYGTTKAATWSYLYDPNCLGIRQITDPNGHSAVMNYDAAGNLLTMTDALGRTTKYTYDSDLGAFSFNNLFTITDANNITTTFNYDGSNINLIQKSTPCLLLPSNDPCGTSPDHSISGNQSISYGYGDAAHPGDMRSMTDSNGKVWTYSYGGNGNLTATTDPLASTPNTVRYCYDTIGRRTRLITPKGTAAGVTCATASPTFTYIYGYNAFGDMTSTTDPLNHQSSRVYDADRNLKQVVDPDTNPTNYDYDLANELKTVTRADMTTLMYDYFDDGTLQDQKDGLHNPTTYDYNVRGQLKSVVDPNLRQTKYAYDAVGNLLTKTDPGGDCTTVPSTGCSTYTYDVADQLSGITYSSDLPTPAVTNLTYDADGQRTGMTDGTGTSTWQWDSLHRLTTSTNGAGKTATFGFDLKSQLIYINYGATASVTRSYDDAGRLSGVSDWLSHNFVFDYDANSNLQLETYPTGLKAKYIYDDADRLTTINHKTATNSVFASFTYGRDNAGLVNSVTSTGVPADNHSYSYTLLNKLQNVDNATPPAYGYDAADNVTHLANGKTLAYDAANQLCWTQINPSTSSCTPAPSGSTTFLFDSNGNRIMKSAPGATPVNYTYDRANRLTNFSSSTGSGSYTYNGDGLRMSKTVAGVQTAFLWDEAEGVPLLLKDGSNRLVYGPDDAPIEQVDASNNTLYFHQDQLASTRLLTDSTATVAASYTYDAYGKLATKTGTATTSMQYASQYTDAESGLQYLRARYYDSGVGQFLSKDPAVAVTNSAYGYVSGNPLNGSDPTGLYEYTRRHTIGAIEQYGSSADVMSVFRQSFHQAFPFPISGCKQLRPGATCTLHPTPYSLKGRGLVRVGDWSANSFSFVVIGSGYFDPIGSKITFSTCEEGGNVILEQHGDAPETHGLPNVLAPLLAKDTWNQQADNLRDLAFLAHNPSASPSSYGKLPGATPTPPSGFPT